MIRHFIYTAAAMLILQNLASPFGYGDNKTKTFIIVALSITIIVYLSRPLLKLISFPVGGLIYTMLLVLVVGAGFYALQSVIPDFAVQSFTLSRTGLSAIIRGGSEFTGFRALGFVSVFTAVFISLIGWVMG